ncbi:MAG: anti-sigma factor antagonist [Acidimicrobiaceae bacterium]|jgi:anti-sigma B factor antagonist
MELGLVVRDQDGWVVLAVSGEIDIATAPSLRERLHALLAEDKRQLVVDLDDVGFLDSTALGVLVGVLKRARSEGGEVRIVCTQPRVRKVFEITRLDSAFDLFDSVDEAVRGARE